MIQKYPYNINKFIAESGLTSRRGADKLIKENKVKINGKVALPINKVHPKDIIEVNGKIISHQKPKEVYLAFNKPIGVITTTDKNSPNNIIDYIKYPIRIFPVGRLDVNTSGLILLTNDGSIVNRILKGQNKVEKEYLVEVDKTVNDGFLHQIEIGVNIEGHKTLPSKTKKINEKTFSLIIHEGKKRQVRRMCEKLGHNVLKLKRIRIGNLKLDNISTGKYIELEKAKLQKMLNL